MTFDLFLASEKKCFSIHRFWDAEHENDHGKAWLAAVCKKN